MGKGWSIPFNFNAWHVNQPDNLLGNQNCLMLALNKEFEWDDNNCQNHRNVICEKSKWFWNANKNFQTAKEIEQICFGVALHPVVKVCSCFFKVVVVFNTTPVDFVLMSADVILKTTTILKEMRIAQISSKNVRTFSSWSCQRNSVKTYFDLHFVVVRD